jgi:hypothetical protein
MCAAEYAPTAVRPASQADRVGSVPVARPSTFRSGAGGRGPIVQAPLGASAILGGSDKVFSLFSTLEGPPRVVAA